MAAQQQGTPAEAVRRVLDGRAEGRRVEQILADLVELGPSSAEALFEVVLKEAADRTASRPSGLAAARGIAGQALRRLDRDVVRGVLARRAGSQPGALEAVLVLELYAELGRGNDLDVGLAIGAGLRDRAKAGRRGQAAAASPASNPAPSPAPSPAALAERGRRALAGWFERDARAASLVHDRRAFLSESERALVDEVFLAVDHPLALSILSRRARAGRHPDDGLLVRLGELGDRYPWRIGGEDLRLWEALSFSPLWSERRAACMLVGAWRRPEAFEHLTELAEDDPHPMVRQAAGAALSRIAGCERTLNAAGWRRWFEARTAAWQRTAAVALPELGGSDPSVVARAVAELAGFRMHRHELAPAVAAVLEAHPQLAEQVATALYELDSRACLPVLIELARENDDPHLAEALRRTLVHLGVRASIEDPRWAQVFSRY